MNSLISFLQTVACNSKTTLKKSKPNEFKDEKDCENKFVKVADNKNQITAILMTSEMSVKNSDTKETNQNPKTKNEVFLRVNLTKMKPQNHNNLIEFETKIINAISLISCKFAKLQNKLNSLTTSFKQKESDYSSQISQLNFMNKQLIYEMQTLVEKNKTIQNLEEQVKKQKLVLEENNEKNAENLFQLELFKNQVEISNKLKRSLERKIESLMENGYITENNELKELELDCMTRGISSVQKGLNVIEENEEFDSENEGMTCVKDDKSTHKTSFNQGKGQITRELMIEKSFEFNQKIIRDGKIDIISLSVDESKPFDWKLSQHRASDSGHTESKFSFKSPNNVDHNDKKSKQKKALFSISNIRKSIVNLQNDLVETQEHAKLAIEPTRKRMQSKSSVSFMVDFSEEIENQRRINSKQQNPTVEMLLADKNITPPVLKEKRNQQIVAEKHIINKEKMIKFKMQQLIKKMINYESQLSSFESLKNRIRNTEIKLSLLSGMYKMEQVHSNFASFENIIKKKFNIILPKNNTNSAIKMTNKISSFKEGNKVIKELSEKNVKNTCDLMLRQRNKSSRSGRYHESMDSYLKTKTPINQKHFGEKESKFISNTVDVKNQKTQEDKTHENVTEVKNPISSFYRSFINDKEFKNSYGNSKTNVANSDYDYNPNNDQEKKGFLSKPGSFGLSTLMQPIDDEEPAKAIIQTPKMASKTIYNTIETKDIKHRDLTTSNLRIAVLKNFKQQLQSNDTNKNGPNKLMSYSGRSKNFFETFHPSKTKIMTQQLEQIQNNPIISHSKDHVINEFDDDEPQRKDSANFGGLVSSNKKKHADSQRFDSSFLMDIKYDQVLVFLKASFEGITNEFACFQRRNKKMEKQERCKEFQIISNKILTIIKNLKAKLTKLNIEINKNQSKQFKMQKKYLRKNHKSIKIQSKLK